MQVSPKDVGLILWWIIWFSILSSVLLINFITPAPTGPLPPMGPLSYLPLAPLFLGSAIRWLVLPRMKAKEHALAAFLSGLALCESCAILGIFLAPEMRTTYVVLAVLGLIQFMPVFAVKSGK
jgi:hypothetical protein